LEKKASLTDRKKRKITLFGKEKRRTPFLYVFLKGED